MFTFDSMYATLVWRLRYVRCGFRKPKFFRPSNSKPVRSPSCALAHEFAFEEDSWMTTASMGWSRFLWKALSDTSSSGEKNHSQRKSKFSRCDSTRSGLPMVGRRARGDGNCVGESSRNSGRETERL